MANPSCIVESGKLSPVGQRNLNLFQAQSDKRMLVVLMSDEHVKIGYYRPEPSELEAAAWMLPFRAAGISVDASVRQLRSDTKAVVVLTVQEWAVRRDIGRFKDNVFQIWGDGGEARSWPVMAGETSPIATK